MKSRIFSRLATVFFSLVTLLAVFTTQAVALPKENSTAPAKNNISLSLNEQGVAAVKAKDFQRAENLFKQAMESDPQNLTAVFNLASMYINNKKQTEAISLLQDYTKKAPDDAGLFARIGDAHFTLKEVTPAVAAYEKALKLDPQYPGIAKKLGTLYVLNKKFELAEKYFLQAVEQDPKNGELLSTLSNLFLGNGKADQAISTAKRALQVSPSKEMYVTLGSAYEMKRDFKNSLIAYQRALDLGDTTPEVKEKVASLKKMNS